MWKERLTPYPVTLSEAEAEVLERLAQAELRRPWVQIRVLVREGLQKRGLLPSEQEVKDDPHQTAIG